MRRPHRSTTVALFSAGTGAALAWLAFSTLADNSAPAAASARHPVDVGEAPAAEADRRTPPRPEPVVQTAAEAPPDAAVEPSSSGAFARNPIVSDLVPRDLPLTPTDLPNRRADDLAARTPAAALLDSTRITCDFGAGNNTGIRFNDTLSVGGGAQWQGGLMVYDLVDASAGVARLTGSVGATGSPNGEAKAQVTTEGSRVLLSGFLANRAFVAVTIFDELDNDGRHIAVMSRHENFFTYASQFLGTCE